MAKTKNTGGARLKLTTSGGLSSESKLPLWIKGIYGAGYFGFATLQNAFYFFAMLFYTDVVRLSSELVGIALAVGRFFDAFTDPLMGQISDKTRTRFGRRRPYVMFGSIYWGIIFVLVWAALPDWQPFVKFTYLLLMDTLFALGVTVFQTPYMALGAELSLDYSERSSITAYRMAFMQIGNIVGAGLLTLADLIKPRLEQIGQQSSVIYSVLKITKSLPNAEWTTAAIVLAVISVTTMFMSGLVPKERFASRTARGFTSWQALKTTLSNANYRRVIAVHVVNWAAGFREDYSSQKTE